MGVNPNGGRTSGRLPRGPHRLSSEQVAAHQRERLIEAMVHLVAERGFAATPVTELIERARVSRKTFYAYFSNREDLLLAAFERCSEEELQQARVDSEGPDGSVHLERLIAQLSRQADARPGAIVICSLEVMAANDEGERLRNEFMTSYGSFVNAGLGAAGEHAPHALADAIAGALHRTILGNLIQQSPRESGVLARELTRWACCYRPLPRLPAAEAEPYAPSWPWLGGVGLAGGRAPGTLTLEPTGYLRRRGHAPTGFEEHTNRERILDALVQLNAEQGFIALSAEAIADRAELPLGAFRAQFSGKDDAVAAALDLGHMKGQAIVARARRGSPSWSMGARDATRALLEFLASEPQFAKLALIDAPLAGRDMARRVDEHVDAYSRILFDGASGRRSVPPLTPKASMNALFETAYRNALQGHLTGATLFQSAFIVLAPVTGVARAVEMSRSAVS